MKRLYPEVRSLVCLFPVASEGSHWRELKGEERERGDMGRKSGRKRQRREGGRERERCAERKMERKRRGKRKGERGRDEMEGERERDREREIGKRRRGGRGRKEAAGNGHTCTWTCTHTHTQACSQTPMAPCFPPASESAMPWLWAKPLLPAGGIKSWDCQFGHR